MDILTVFCQIDGFCNEFEPRFNQMPLSDGNRQRNKPGAMRLSEVMTILAQVSLIRFSQLENLLQWFCLLVLARGVSCSVELHAVCRTSA